MENARLIQLIDRALNGTASAEERTELQELLADVSNKDAVMHILQDKWEAFESKTVVFTEEQGEEILQNILGNSDETSSNNKGIHPLFPWFKVVAAVLLATTAWGVFDFYSDRRDRGKLTLEQAVMRYGIEPGKDQAMIVLTDGQTVALDASNPGLLAQEGGVRLYNSIGGKVRYNALSGEKKYAGHHTIKIPKGGHYHVELEDGTKVHLNAESSLRLPVPFTAETREVELIGEGFFEVAADATRPFLVKTPLQTVRVLGTMFNVRAYPDSHGTRTTLLKGLVQVARQDTMATLQPGEAAVCQLGTSGVNIQRSDVDVDLAWHHGYFVFNNEHIASIMDRVARWYDIDVKYQGNMENIRLGGIFQRSKSITQLLESFETTGLVKFNIEERRITVVGKTTTK